MDSEPVQPLSEQGEKRRRQILLLARGEARRRRRRRFSARGGALVIIALLATITFVSTRHPQIVARRSPIAHVLSPSQPAVAIEYLQTDPTITDRLTIKPQPPRWISISDRELLDEMATAGQPAGIVCMNGKTILLPR